MKNIFKRTAHINEESAVEERDVEKVEEIEETEAVEETIEERDIRAHEWEDDNFDIKFTDSTCPFTRVLEEIKTPGMSYIWALNHQPRINYLLQRKWHIVDPSRLSNRPTFDIDKRYENLITVGDTVLMERDTRYSKREEQTLQLKHNERMYSALTNLKKHEINDLNQPFNN